MEEFSQDVSSLVNSMFHVSDFTKTEFSLEFKIGDLDFREKFGVGKKVRGYELCM